MPGPTFEPYDWATDTNHPAGSDPWSGQPNKVDPGAGLKATGWAPTDNPAAEHLNHVLSRTAGWVSYIRTFVDEANDLLVYPSPVTRSILLTPSAHVADGWVDGTPTGSAESSSLGAFFQVDLRQALRAGDVLNDVELIVEPSTARSSSLRMSATVRSRPVVPSLPATIPVGSSLGFAEDDGTTAIQAIAFSGLDVTITDPQMLFLNINAGNSGSAGDLVHEILLRVTETRV